MKREKFIQQCADRSGTTPEHVLEYHDVVRCECGKKKCPGWRANYKLRNRREPRRQSAVRSAVDRPTGFVYFASLGDLVKIGFSTNPVERAASLSGELLGVVKGDRELEARLHVEFAGLRERGEWFRSDPVLLARIEALCK